MSLSKFICNIVDVMKSVYYSKPEIDAKVDSLNNAKANIEHTHKNIVKTGILPNGADLNDYTSVGYWTANIAVTATLLNKPTNPPISSNSGIRLEVLENSNGAIQIITTYHVNAEQVNIYFRHYEIKCFYVKF